MHVLNVKKNRFLRLTSILLVATVLGVGLVYAKPVLAATEWVTDYVGPIILYAIFWPFIWLLNLLTVLLMKVAMYNDFASATIVEKGWPIVRDISNMFFVLVLLIIAIGTIVKWEKVNYRQNLRRLVIMALLINFSKTIVVFFIDISQIFTLTFMTEVNKVIQVGMITALGLDRIANPVTQGSLEAVGQATISLFTYIMAGIMVAVACLTVAVIVIIFLGRVISLWMLIVFAPMAFLSSALPQTRKWYDKWWDMLGSNLTVAPVLAFMLWLVFAVVAEGGLDPTGALTNTEGSAGGVNSSDIITFAAAIGILIYAVKTAINMGTVGGSMAQRLQGKVSGAAKRVGGAAVNRVSWGKSGQGGVLGRAKSAGLRAAEVTASGLSTIPVVGRLGAAMGRSATIARKKQDRVRDKAETERLKDLDVNQQAALQRGGLFTGRMSAPLRRAFEARGRMSGAKLASEAESLDRDDRAQQVTSWRNEAETLAQRQRTLRAAGGELSQDERRRFENLRVAVSKTDTTTALDMLQANPESMDMRTIVANAEPTAYRQILEHNNGETFRAHVNQVSHSSVQDMLTTNQLNTNEKENVLRYIGEAATGGSVDPTTGNRVAIPHSNADTERRARSLLMNAVQSTATSAQVENTLSQWATLPQAPRVPGGPPAPNVLTTVGAGIQEYQNQYHVTQEQQRAARDIALVNQNFQGPVGPNGAPQTPTRVTIPINNTYETEWEFVSLNPATRMVTVRRRAGTPGQPRQTQIPLRTLKASNPLS